MASMATETQQPQSSTNGAVVTAKGVTRVYGAGERPLYRLGVSEEVFAAQLDLLVQVGLAPVTVAEGLAFLESGAAGRRVAMSFDDGYADNVTRALPLLAARGARASFYLTAGWIERREPAWWDVKPSHACWKKAISCAS